MKQVPEGNINGYYGVIVRGNNSGKLYIKRGSKTALTTEGFRHTGQPHKMYVGDNSSPSSGARTPRHAIIIGSDGRIHWTPLTNNGYLTMNGTSVY